MDQIEYINITFCHVDNYGMVENYVYWYNKDINLRHVCTDGIIENGSKLNTFKQSCEHT
jgi:saccharopine dehydrogenase-like NADP-dependent oxidoreductase